MESPDCILSSRLSGMGTDKEVAEEPESADRGEAPVKLLDLPRPLLYKIIDSVALLSTPGAVVQLAMASRATLDAVQDNKELWMSRISAVGWRDNAPPETTEAPPTSSSGSTPEHKLGAVMDSYGQNITLATRQPFLFFCQRMQLRWRLRALMKRYILFMPRLSQMSFAKGATLEVLNEVEERLGVKLPWEAWETLRFRNGQVAMPGAEFVDSARLLSAAEVVEELLPVVKTFTIHRGYVVSRRRRQGGGSSDEGDGGIGGLGQGISDDVAPPDYIGGGKEGNELLIPLTTAMAGNKRVGCGAATGNVYFIAGFTVIWKFDSWTNFLVSLLR